MTRMSEPANKYIRSRSPGLFDHDMRLADLSRRGDLLHRLDQVVDWDLFVPPIEKALAKPAVAPGGRPAWHPKVLFKLLIVQRLYNLSDEQAEFQLADRLSFQRFVGLTLADAVPDRNTLWGFREELRESGVLDQLFALFNEALRSRGLLPKGGHIVDATFVEVPKQRNTREENAEIKEGRVPKGWLGDDKLLSHKDVDARWTKKNEQTFFGYKNHVKVNSQSKLIEAAVVTHAAVHDSQALADLARSGDGVVYADSAYTGAPISAMLSDRHIEPRICEKGTSGRPLSKEQMESNRDKSQVRSRVEHVFAVMSGQAGRIYMRYIGEARNEAAVVILNLTYNLVRYEQIVRLKLMPLKG
jgi:IS5 family transposase